MRIQNNVTADNSHRQLGVNTRAIAVNMEKLSSGYRVNRAADDAAGLAISEKMRTQIKGLNRASINIQDGISLLQVGDGGLQSVHNKMQRLRELSVQSANDTNQRLDREAIQLEFGQLTSEINDLISRLSFNDRLIFDGSIGASWEYNLGKMTVPYTTTVPAADDFAATGADVPGWTITPGVFGVSPPTQDLNTITWPTSGIFAMQLVTPADGTLNVILDFATTPITNVSQFLDYYKNAFNSLGLGNVVEDIRYTAANRIEFDFPMNGNSLTGVMGKPVADDPVPFTMRPRVVIGLGSWEAPGSPDDFMVSAMRDSLNGVADTAWATGPFRTYPAGYPTITSATEFANASIFLSGSNQTITVPGPAAIPTGGFANFTITVDGSPTTIQLIPGNYPTVQDFMNANRMAFETAMPRGFDLMIDDETDRLYITTKIYGDDRTPTVSLNIHPASLASMLGFVGTGNITTVRDNLDALWIQSGANEGDGILIEIPRLCTRSLGLSILRPQDERVPPDGFEHTNGLGADGYTTIANVTGAAGTPMQYSLDVTSHETASAALGVLTNAINIISTERARIGSQQNRLEYTMSNVDNTAENLQAAESRIRDADMAGEMTILVKNQILQHSSTAMLAQANALPQGVLSLLA